MASGVVFPTSVLDSHQRLQRFSLVAYSPPWTLPLVHHRIKKNCHSDLRLYTRRGGAAAFCDGCSSRTSRGVLKGCHAVNVETCTRRDRPDGNAGGPGRGSLGRESGYARSRNEDCCTSST
jgi:hypothetical protein